MKVEFDEVTNKALMEVFGRYIPAKRLASGRNEIGDRQFDVELDCGNSTITYQMLKKVAEIFGTDKIDVNNSIHSGGGCETCAYEEVEITIQVYEPTRNVPQPKK